jgi:hypothetical protein
LVLSMANRVALAPKNFGAAIAGRAFFHWQRARVQRWESKDYRSLRFEGVLLFSTLAQSPQQKGIEESRAKLNYSYVQFSNSCPSNAKICSERCGNNPDQNSHSQSAFEPGAHAVHFVSG